MTEKEKALWLAGVNAEPVFRDGLTSNLTYLIFGVRNQDEIYTCVCARKFDENSYKVKFYPNYQHWGVTIDQLRDIGAFSFLDRSQERNAGYIRFFLNRNGMVQLIALLQSLRGVTAIPSAEPVFQAYLTQNKGQRGRVQSIVHPFEGGGAPPLPFVPPKNTRLAIEAFQNKAA